MSLLTSALVIIIIGVLLWLAQTDVLMDANIKKVLTAVMVIALSLLVIISKRLVSQKVLMTVVIIALVLWMLGVFGMINIGAIRLR